MRYNRVLVICEEPEWNLFVLKALDREVVVTARNVAEARGILANERFNMIVVDACYMWELEGLRQYNIPFAIATLSPNPKEARDAYKAGAAHYFPKSFNSFDLRQALDEVS